MNWVLLFTPLVLGSISGLASGSFQDAPQVPGFRPPDWVFGPVWTILYLLMGLAAAQSKSVPMIFWVQLALNILWSPVFVRFRNPQLALAIIIALWASIFMTIKQLGSQGRLLYPYLAWVSFAAYLNAKVVFPRLSTVLEGTE
jgi:tryptophan-rich sensory protein